MSIHEPMTISNSTPLITLSKIQGIPLLQPLFGTVSIPWAVYHETVEHAQAPVRQQQLIRAAIADGYLVVERMIMECPLHRQLGLGERQTLYLAIARRPDHLILDDKQARNEAVAQGLGGSLINTVTVLKKAETMGLISYAEAITRLKDQGEILSET